MVGGALLGEMDPVVEEAREKHPTELSAIAIAPMRCPAVHGRRMGLADNKSGYADPEADDGSEQGSRERPIEAGRGQFQRQPAAVSHPGSRSWHSMDSRSGSTRVARANHPSRCTVSGENAGKHTATYSAPSAPGVA